MFQKGLRHVSQDGKRSLIVYEGDESEVPEGLEEEAPREKLTGPVQVKAHIVGTTKLAQGRPQRYEQLEGESWKDYQDRTAWLRMHFDHKTREIVIPALYVEKLLITAFKREGFGDLTGKIIVREDVRINRTLDDVKFEYLFIPCHPSRSREEAELREEMYATVLADAEREASGCS